MFLRKLIKIGATRCQILRLKCTKFGFGAGGAYSAPPDLLAGLRDPTSKGKGRRGGPEEGREGGGREGKGRGLDPLVPLVKSTKICPV